MRQENSLEDWGAARLHAIKRKMRQRQAMMARRNVSTGRFVPAPAPNLFEVFETTSGVMAYRKRMPNLGYIGALMTDKATGTDVTLPWVSMLRLRLGKETA